MNNFFYTFYLHFPLAVPSVFILHELSLISLTHGPLVLSMESPPLQGSASVPESRITNFYKSFT